MAIAQEIVTEGVRLFNAMSLVVISFWTGLGFSLAICFLFKVPRMPTLTRSVTDYSFPC